MSLPVTLALVTSLAASEAGAPPAVEKAAPEFESLPVRRLVGDAAVLRFLRKDGEQGPLRVVPESCICLRGLFPRQEQIALMAKTLRIEPKLAKAQFQLLDFELERQESADAKPDWKSLPWKEVSNEKALKLLEAAPEFVDDVVHRDHLEPVISMPLPKLSAGNWKTLGAHPDLKPGRASGNSLFRYLDSDVAKDRTYRYRVRLTFQHDVREMPSLETRQTPWSEPTTPILVAK